MTAHRKPSLLTPVIALVLILLVGFGAYMGAYYAMVEEVAVHLVPAPGRPEWEAAAVYRYERPLIHIVFRPASQIDKWVRPAAWGSDLKARPLP